MELNESDLIEEQSFNIRKIKDELNKSKKKLFIIKNQFKGHNNEVIIK